MSSSNQGRQDERREQAEPPLDEAGVACDDGRQSERAAAIQRGVQRLFHAHGFSSVTELVLATGRRADVVALGPKSEITIVEIKSSLADFRTDQKWHEYAAFCDRFAFAVDADFPTDVLPDDVGLIIADRYGGAFVRPSPEHRLAAARRKAVVLRFARAAADRLMLARDPGLLVTTMGCAPG